MFNPLTYIVNLVVWLAHQPILLIIIWLIYLLLQRVWGGLANFLSIILFPGMFLKRGEQISLASFFGSRPRVTAWIPLLRSGDFSFVRVYMPRNPFHAAITVLLPALINLSLAYGLIVLLKYIQESISALIIAWLIISLFVTGFPDKFDLSIIISSLIATDPTLIFYYAWMIIIFVFFLIGYDPFIALTSTFIYFVFITITSAYFTGREEESIVVLDEEE